MTSNIGYFVVYLHNLLVVLQIRHVDRVQSPSGLHPHRYSRKLPSPPMREEERLLGDT